MTRSFFHTFDPPALSPVDDDAVEMTVRQVEDAGLREVLQTPGASFGSWALLDGLLHPGTPFVFRSPLGHAREVKVALSGLLGRFVARAYLEKYFGLSVFLSIGRAPIALDGRRQITIVRRGPGDLPDWVAAKSPDGVPTIVEAKGSHDPSGPARALDRAWTQAGRVAILLNRRRSPVKRMAVATRWGVHGTALHDPWISVRDPIDEGDPVGPDEMAAIYVGLYRHHAANMIAPLGHAALAASLRALAGARSAEDERQAGDRARRLLDVSSSEPSDRAALPAGAANLIGGIVTRAGPLAGIAVSRADREPLARLDLRPVFVGIRPQVIAALIEGDPSSLGEALVLDKMAGPSPDRSDRAGGWLLPLDE